MLIFKNLLDLGIDFFLAKIFVVIHDSMQLDELILNITFVLRQNVCLFSKPVIPRPKPGFEGDLLLGLCSNIEYGPMTKDKPYIGE
jgi:hypothetical protein